MNLYHIVFSSLRRRKIKILLVMLGVVIGIATVVSTNSLVEAMKTELAKQQSNMGANLIIMPDTGGLSFSYGGIAVPEVVIGSQKKASSADVETINNLPSAGLIHAVAPSLLGSAASGEQRVIVAGIDLQNEFRTKPWLRLQREPGSGSGTTVQFSHENGEGPQGVMQLQLLDLEREDLQRLIMADNQVMMGSAVAAALGSSTGDFLLLQGREYEVVSLLETNGSSEDNFIFMNLQAAQELLGRPGEVSTIQLSLVNPGDEAILLQEISSALPHLRAVSLQQALLGRDELLNRLSRLGFTLSLLVLFAGLLVVSLGIAAAVKERTREIGVFRAIGFRKRHVFKMILLEGVFISLGGGVLGYMAGILLTRLLAPLLLGARPLIPWRPELFLLALLLALILGLLASFYPARQAAKLDPAEALRFY